jgi:hypothetical protein
VILSSKRKKEKNELFSLRKKQNVDILSQKTVFEPQIYLKINFKRQKILYISRALKCCFKALDCIKHAFFAYFMSEQIQIFDIKLKILFRFNIETKADHNLCFDSISKQNVRFYSSCSVHERKIYTTTFHISAL